MTQPNADTNNTLVEVAVPKKSGAVMGLVGSGVVLGLVAAAVGGAWYSGKEVERRSPALFEDFGKQLTEKINGIYPTGYSVTFENYTTKRGLFSSDVKYMIKVKNRKGEVEQSIPFSGKLYHGPFPLNLLTKGGLAPKSFSLEIKPEQLPDVNLQLSSSYDSDVQGNISYPGKEWIDVKGTGKIKGVNFEFNLDSNNNAIDRVTGNLTVDEVALLSTVQDLNIKDYKVGFDFQPETEQRNAILNKLVNSTGNYSLKLLDDNHEIKYASAKSEFTTQEKDNFVNYKLSGATSSFTLDGVSLGNVNSSISLEHIPSKVIRALPEALKNRDEKALQALGFDVLLSHPQIKFDTILKHKSGDSFIKFDLGLKSVNPTHIENEKWGELISPLNLEAKLDKSGIGDILMEYFQKVEKLSGNEARVAADKGILEVSEALVSLGYVANDPKQISTSIKLENNQLVINGKPQPLDLMDKNLAPLLSAYKDESIPSLGLEDLFANAISNNSADSTSAVEPEVEQKVEPVITHQQEAPRVPVQEVQENVVAQPVAQPATQAAEPASAVNLPPACHYQGGDDLGFIQSCLKENPNSDQILEVVKQAKAANACIVARRLYANRGQNGDAKVAFAYAKEFDPQFVQNGCFSADPETAVYWYETGLGFDANNAEAKARVAALKK